MSASAIREDTLLLRRHSLSIDLTYEMPHLGENSGVITF
jgi:hypothetical protein